MDESITVIGVFCNSLCGHCYQQCPTMTHYVIDELCYVIVLRLFMTLAALKARYYINVRPIGRTCLYLFHC